MKCYFQHPTRKYVAMITWVLIHFVWKFCFTYKNSFCLFCLFVYFFSCLPGLPKGWRGSPDQSAVGVYTFWNMWMATDIGKCNVIVAVSLPARGTKRKRFDIKDRNHGLQIGNATNPPSIHLKKTTRRSHLSCISSRKWSNSYNIQICLTVFDTGTSSIL